MVAMESGQWRSGLGGHKEWETAGRQAVAEAFEGEYGRPLGSRAGVSHARGNVAWASQARAQGLDPYKLRKRLARQLSVAIGSTSRQQSVYRPGTRLVREWQGKVHEVTVLDRGYAWQGQTYRSLTEIATAITGSKWSGPRFFGLRSRRK